MVTSRPISQPTATTLSVVDLVSAARAGRLRIPEFQRPLRWQWEDVRRLFDSILRGYPIGNLLLWKRPAPAAEIRLGEIRIDAPAYQEGLWVVDGQQRLASLANALSDEGLTSDRFALAYDLDAGAFVRPSTGNDADGYLIPLPVLFDLQRLFRWFTKEHPEAGERLDDASRVTTAIRDYKVPAYLVDQEDEAELRVIFDRLNNSGKRLTRAEVFAALHPGQEAAVEPFSAFQRIADNIDRERGFGRLDDDTVLRAVLARRGGNVSREIRTEFTGARTREPRDFEDEAAETAYREGELALSRAVRFLIDDAGVPHFAFLPYRYLVVVLTRFFAHFPEPHPANRGLLGRWFWRAAMAGPGPFASSWTNAMRVLATRIVAGDESGSIQRLLDAPIDKELRCPSLTGFRTNTAASRIIMAALWDLTPRSLLTGQPYERAELVEAISPDGTLKDVAHQILRRETEKVAANRLFVLEEELPEGVPTLLERAADRGGDAVLASHALDTAMVDKLAQRDTRGFLSDRQARIEGVVRTFLQRMAETEFEDTPPLDDFDLDDSEGRRDDEIA